MLGSAAPKLCQETFGSCYMGRRTKKWICQVLTRAICASESLPPIRELRQWLRQLWATRLASEDAEEIQQVIKLLPIRVINSGAVSTLGHLVAIGLATPAWLTAFAYELEAARDTAASHILTGIRPHLEVAFRNKHFYAVEAIEGIVMQLFLLEVRKRCVAPSIIWLHDGFWIDKQVDDGILSAAERHIRSLLFPLSAKGSPLFHIADLTEARDRVLLGCPSSPYPPLFLNSKCGGSSSGGNKRFHTRQLPVAKFSHIRGVPNGRFPHISTGLVNVLGILGSDDSSEDNTL